MSIREEVQKLLETDHSLTRAGIARACGINAGALSSWLNEKYEGNNDSIEKAISAFLRRNAEKQRAAEIKTDIVVKTSIFRKVDEIARTVHAEGEIGVICGDAGLGKTVAASEYAAKNPGVIFVEADMSYTARSLFQEIHRALGLGGSGSLSAIVAESIQRLQDSGRLIIVDEAEYLPRRALDLLRRLHDRAGVGILLIGLPKLIHLLRGSRGEYAQLYSRVGIYTLLKKISASDSKRLVAAAIPKASEEWRHFHTAASGNTRRMAKLLRRSVRIARLNQTEISADVIAEAAKTLII